MSSAQKGQPAPQSQGFQPGPMTQQPAMVVTAVRPIVIFGPSSQPFICPYCYAHIMTQIKSSPTTRTHLIAVLLCCCICWPCVILPYCMDSCQAVSHYCPNCGAFLGRYEN